MQKLSVLRVVVLVVDSISLNVKINAITLVDAVTVIYDSHTVPIMIFGDTHVPCRGATRQQCDCDY
jgi:hypothetical protein